MIFHIINKKRRIKKKKKKKPQKGNILQTVMAYPRADAPTRVRALVINHDIRIREKTTLRYTYFRKSVRTSRQSEPYNITTHISILNGNTIHRDRGRSRRSNVLSSSMQLYFILYLFNPFSASLYIRFFYSIFSYLDYSGISERFHIRYVYVDIYTYIYIFFIFGF